MKRVKEACICQTLHFMLKEDVPHSYAVRAVEEEEQAVGMQLVLLVVHVHVAVKENHALLAIVVRPLRRYHCVPSSLLLLGAL